VSRLPIAALAAALSTAAAAADGDTKLALRLPQEKQVLFRGVSSLDGAGGGGAQMMYPAPNAAGLLAAVLTHAFISESTRNAEKDKIQEAADKVLAPYQDVLKDFEHRQLMQRALEKASAPREKRLIEAAETAPGETIIESLPVFSMTQDQSAIVLDNSIVIYAPPASSKPVYKNTIRVVARPKEAADLVPFWTAGQGEALKAESARLFAASLELALSDAAKELGRTDAVHKTVRYHEGGSEKMERAQILDHACDRMVIRTLRDSLMSVPLKRTEGTPGAACASAILD
jgi:hypothetical protein